MLERWLNQSLKVRGVAFGLAFGRVSYVQYYSRSVAFRRMDKNLSRYEQRLRDKVPSRNILPGQEVLDKKQE